MSLEQEEQLQQKLSNWRSGFSKDQAKVSKQKDRAEALDDAMKRIRELTGAHGIDEFIDHFLRFEEANFRSFEIHNALIAGKCLLAVQSTCLLCSPLARCAVQRIVSRICFRNESTQCRR